MTPVENYTWQRWGRGRLHVSFCGHAVHEACWDAYFANLVQHSLSIEQHFEGNLTTDLTSTHLT